MNPFVIRTAAPFGYLFVGLVLLSVGLLGLALLARGLWRRRYRQAGFGLCVGLFVAYVLWVNVAEGNALELNPQVSAATLSGRWMHGDAVLVLRSNGRYECRGAAECESVGVLGSWTYKDYDVTLVSTHSSTAQDFLAGARYRVVSYNGALRLASPIDDDPDMWDGNFFWSANPQT
jgi:hypothetical protein